MSIGMELDNSLLESAFSNCTAVDRPQSFPNSGEALVFFHTVSLVDRSATDPVEVKRISIDIADFDETLLIVVPKEVKEPSAKRRTLNSRAFKRKPVHIAKVTGFKNASDASLCSSLVRQRIGISNTYGPFLVQFNDNSVVLEFGVSLVPDRVSTVHQAVSIKFLARALNDPALDTPDSFMASPAELMAAITKVPKTNPPKIEPIGLNSKLFPYQCESVEWCLKREGKCLSSASTIADLDPSIRDIVVSPPLGWRKISDSFWVNPYLLRTSSKEPSQFTSGRYKGKGLLSEEMGLGKTLEILSLILMNQRPKEEIQKLVSKATMIIVPKAILHQWNHEIQIHTPNLKVVIVDKKKTTLDEIVNADIVLITYSELGRWLPKATFKRKKLTRFNLAEQHMQERIESTGIDTMSLAKVEFWRVVLDEVQMVSTGASTAAEAAAKVPRVHAWAVSGTPVKQTLEDLRGITYFLNLQPFVERPSWKRLISSAVDFQQTLSLVGFRHTLAMVREQLNIPQQHRNLVLLKLSEVERTMYDNLYREFKRNAETPNCNFPQWLTRLRQSFISVPENFNTRDSKLNGAQVGGNFALTLDQLLTKLVDDADTKKWSIIRSIHQTKIRIAQFYDKADRLIVAFEVLKDLEEEVNHHLSATKDAVEELSGKMKSLEVYIKKEESGESDIREDDNQELIAVKQEKSITEARLTSFRVKHKSLQEMMHRIYFFLGTGYFRASQRLRLKLKDDKELESPHIKALFEANGLEETKYYNLAESVRNEILYDLETKVEKLISAVNPIHFTKANPFLSIYAAKAFDLLADFYSEINDTLLQVLQLPLMEKQVAQSTEGIQLEEDFYSKTFDLQDSAFVYMEIMQMLLYDRTIIFNGGTIPEKIEYYENANGKISDLGCNLIKRRNEIVNTLRFHRDPPLTNYFRMSSHPDIASKIKSEIQKSQSQYTVVCSLYNSRVEYYKQLQFISDQVTDPAFPKTAELDAYICKLEKSFMTQKISLQNCIKEQKYLRNMAGTNQSQTQVKDTTHNCIICFDSINNGALAPCGHSFCAECLRQWLTVQKRCPLCQRPLSMAEVVTFKGALPQTQISSVNDKIELDKNVFNLFTPISTQFYNKVHKLDIVRHYGIKVDMIVKLVKQIRSEDPTAQVVLFSQFLSTLKVLYDVFSENGITSASLAKLAPKMEFDIDQFRTDPQVCCLLLDSKSDAAGLTLINANHVVLCEPLMNTAIELQAVSRINRIGQTREMYVWQFCVENTVEQNILATTTKERMQQSTASGGLDTANSLLLAEATMRAMVNQHSGEEIVLDDSRLRQILLS